MYIYEGNKYYLNNIMEKVIPESDLQCDEVAISKVIVYICVCVCVCVCVQDSETGNCGTS